jgi:hypothetical protein
LSFTQEIDFDIKTISLISASAPAPDATVSSVPAKKVYLKYYGYRNDGQVLGRTTRSKRAEEVEAAQQA